MQSHCMHQAAGRESLAALRGRASQLNLQLISPGCCIKAASPRRGSAYAVQVSLCLWAACELKGLSVCFCIPLHLLSSVPAATLLLTGISAALLQTELSKAKPPTEPHRFHRSDIPCSPCRC